MQKARTLKKPEGGFILPDVHSLAYDYVFGHDVKYRCVAGSYAFHLLWAFETVVLAINVC